MKLGRRKPAPPPVPHPFGPWVLRHFARGEALGDLTFAQLERVCSNAASLLCAAAYGEPDAVRAMVKVDRALAGEAALIARRTGDGFKACLADRQHTVIAWPWDHLATRVAWQAVRDGHADEGVVARNLLQLAVSYGLTFREQLGTVLGLWEQVAAGLAAQGDQSRPPSLVEMARQFLGAFETQRQLGA